MLSALGTIVVLGGIEVVIRILDLAPAGPSSPGLARLERFHDLFYELDETLIFRMPPNLQSDFSEFLDNVSGPVSTNGFGYRGPIWQVEKPADTLRIVCLGDSITFGYGAADDETYPARLRDHLRSKIEAPIEVLNLGVPGYSSYQGIRMMEHEVAALNPDILIVGFGFNDAFVKEQTESVYHDQLLATRRGFGRFFADAVDVLGNSALFRFLSKSLTPPATGTSFDDPSKLTSRVPIDEYRTHLENIIERAVVAGTTVVLLNTDFPNAYSLQTLEQLAADHQLTLIDLPVRFAVTAGPQIGGQALPRQDIPVAPDGETTVVLRMRVPKIAPLPAEDEKKFVVRAIVVDDPSHRLDYRMVRLRDNGEAPDLKARDGIWTGLTALPEGSRGEIAFRLDPELGAAFRSPTTFFNSIFFHRLPIPDLPPEQLWETDLVPFNICPFKRWMLDHEDIHPNADGYDLLARLVADAVRETGAFQRHVRQN